MTALYLLFALLAALGFYLASPHQRLWAAGQGRRRALRVCAVISSLVATLCAIAEIGVWAGIFAVLTALMLVLVTLPYVDAARRLWGERNDVG